LRGKMKVFGLLAILLFICTPVFAQDPPEEPTENAENTEVIKDNFASGEGELVKEEEVIISSPDVATATVFPRYSDARTLEEGLGDCDVRTPLSACRTTYWQDHRSSRWFPEQWPEVFQSDLHSRFLSLPCRSLHLHSKLHLMEIRCFDQTRRSAHVRIQILP